MTESEWKDRLPDLVGRIGNNDNEAIAEVIQHYQSKMTNIAKVYTSNTADAEDAVQDAFINAVKHIDKLDDHAKFESWLGSIVVNQAKMIVRKSYHQHETSFTVMEDDDGNLQYDPSDERIDSQPDLKLDQETTRNMIFDILDDLSEEQRIVTVMYFYENKKLREIAEELDIPQSMVVGRLTTAKKNIKASVSEVQKKYDIKLYNFSGVPFFVWLINQFKTTDGTTLIPIGFATTAAASTISTSAAAAAATIVSSSAPAALSIGGKLLSGSWFAKLILGLGICTATVFGGYQIVRLDNSAPEQQTEKPIENKDKESEKTSDKDKDKDKDKEKDDNKNTSTSNNTNNNSNTNNTNKTNTSNTNTNTAPAQQTQPVEQPVEQPSAPAAPVHVHSFDIPIYQTVHHDATGHYEDVVENVWVVDQPEWDEEIRGSVNICQVCGYQCPLGEAIHVHIETEHNWKASYRTEDITTGYVHHDAVGHYENQVTGQTWVQDSGPWDEDVIVGYQCSCGATQ